METNSQIIQKSVTKNEDDLNLEPHQKELLQQLKAKIATDYYNLANNPKNVNFLTTSCYLRYLRARDWNLEKAAKMLEDTLTWRIENDPDNITKDQVKGLMELGSFYRNGKDKEGRPILYIRPGAYNPYPPEQRIKYLIYIMETAIKHMPPGVERITWILDFSDYGNRVNSPDGKVVARNSQHILQNHYPERLGLLFVVNAPWFFWLLYTIVSPFLERKTKEKIRFISGSKEELRKTLSEFIPLDQLEEKYGGTNTSIIQ